MTPKKETGNYLYLGEETFLKKLSVYYSWVAPVILLLLSCVFFYDKAFITGFIILFLSVFLLPILKKHTVRIPKLIRVLIVLALVILAFLSMNLYIE